VSIGLAIGHAGERVEQILERADEALYQAKAAGRNRVVQHGAAPDHAAAVAPEANWPEI
jgi:PleD family two-component response regulator